MGNIIVLPKKNEFSEKQHNYVAEKINKKLHVRCNIIMLPKKNENFFHVNYGMDRNTVEMAASKVHHLHASMQMM